MIVDVIREAGWPIFPVLAFGGSALVLSIHYALAPVRGRPALIIGFGVLTLLLGVLGTALGVMHAIDGVGSDPAVRWMVLIGLREALNNLAAAFVLAVLTALFATVGASRHTS